MGRIKWIQRFLALMLVVSLSSCALQKTEGNEKDEPVNGAILPHHNLVSDYIDAFYRGIADSEVERIILISPNHSDIGSHYIQSTTELPTSLTLDEPLITALEAKGAVGVESISFGAEHGIMVHIYKLEEYFPDAKVTPIILKWKTPQENLDRLIAAIEDEVGKEGTLVIASIDFSHFVTEKTAVENDERTMNWLEAWGAGILEEDISLEMIWELEHTTHLDTPSATGMDSPESFYIFTQLMGAPSKLEIWSRTSSISIFGGENPLQNTSHIFVKVWSQ